MARSLNSQRITPGTDLELYATTARALLMINRPGYPPERVRLEGLVVAARQSGPQIELTLRSLCDQGSEDGTEILPQGSTLFIRECRNRRK